MLSASVRAGADVFGDERELRSEEVIHSFRGAGHSAHHQALVSHPDVAARDEQQRGLKLRLPSQMRRELCGSPPRERALRERHHVLRHRGPERREARPVDHHVRHDVEPAHALRERQRHALPLQSETVEQEGVVVFKVDVIRTLVREKLPALAVVDAATRHPVDQRTCP